MMHIPIEDKRYIDTFRSGQRLTILGPGVFRLEIKYQILSPPVFRRSKYLARGHLAETAGAECCNVCLDQVRRSVAFVQTTY